MSLSERYARALRLTAPKLAAQTAGLSVEGYWLTDTLFYFLAERSEPSLGRVIAVPSLAHRGSGRVEEVISLEELAALLSYQAGNAIDCKALSSAVFDMPDPHTLAVTVKEHDYLIDVKRRRLAASGPSLQGAMLYSPDGRYACFVNEHDIWLRELSGARERALTIDGAAHHRYGQQSETALSALSYRQHPAPMGLWSPDSQWFLTHQIDERSLPELELVQHVSRDGSRPALHRYKYPLPGDSLPVATYVAIHIASGHRVAFADFQVSIAAFSPFSLGRVWFGANERAWLVRLNRYCRQADLIELNLAQDTGRIVVTERVASGYLDFNPFSTGIPNVRTLERTDEVIWFSERDGWGHLYLYEASTGKLKNRITHGDWVVRDIVRVDEDRRRLIFLAGGVDPEADPAYRVLCSVNLDGSGFEVLLAHDGDVFVPVSDARMSGQSRRYRPQNAVSGTSPDGNFAVVRYGSVASGNRTSLVDLRTGGHTLIACAAPGPDDVRVRRFSAVAADGVTRLHGVMFLPSDFDESLRYPLIDNIYPSPHCTWQPQSYRSMNSARSMALAELGFVTIMLDTRGLPSRHRAFHQIGYGSFLEPQLADHAAVVRQLWERYTFIDSERTGIVGNSAGAPATVRALCEYPGVFKVGVASCGTYNPSLYASYWSDKYIGPDGGRGVLAEGTGAAVSGLQGKLLLISGDLDENVPLSQTLGLVDELIRANRDFELLIVPNAGHSVLTVSGYAQRRVWDYFVRNLLGHPPPENFEIRFEPYELSCFARNADRESRQ